MVTPHVMSLPIAIARSDLEGTVPHAIDMYNSKALANTTLMTADDRRPADRPAAALASPFPQGREASGCAS